MFDYWGATHLAHVRARNKTSSQPFELAHLLSQPQAVLFEYDILAGASSNKPRTAAKASSTSDQTQGAAAARATGNVFQPLTSSGEHLVDEITGLLGKARKAAGLGGDSFQDMGKTLIANVKEKMGSGAGPGKPLTTMTMPTPVVKQQQPRHTADSDPKAKYMKKVWARMVNLNVTRTRT